MRRLIRSVSLTALASLLFTSCAGYHIGTIRPKFMAGVQTIAIPTFRNETLIPRIEVLVSDTIIKQIQQDGTYKIANSDASADAILEGEITEVKRKASRTVLGDVQATQEFTMTLSLHYKITRKATGETLDDRTVNGSTEFFVSGDVNQDERQAIPLAAQDAAVRMVSEISEGW